MKNKTPFTLVKLRGEYDYEKQGDRVVINFDDCGALLDEHTMGELSDLSNLILKLNIADITVIRG